MKIIVCGAGSIGKSIVSYLTKGSSDIIVIDDNQRRLDELAQEFDVLPILGVPSHPDILERAGAKDCDIILAVTESDEVNMIVCQLAYSLFNVRKKIAGVKSDTFLDPLWGMLYNDNHLPIDLLISPDIDIAEHILRILQYPGSSGILPVLNGQYCILTINIGSENPFPETPINNIIRQFDDNDVGFINIVRNNTGFIPSMYDTIEAGDEINLLVKCNDIYSVISGFGLEKNTNERLVIFGGGAIAQYICSRIENSDVITSARLIEEDINQARELARRFNRVVVINGEMMSDVILSEADITQADAAIAVTENDKDNLLASLIASKDGVGTTVSLINTPSYNNLMFNIVGNTIVDRSAIAISKLLREIRNSNIASAYSVSRGQGEIWEIIISDENSCVAKKNGELGLPKSCRVIAVLRGEELIYPDLNFKFEIGDKLLVYVDSSKVKQAEDIFC